MKLYQWMILLFANVSIALTNCACSSDNDTPDTPPESSTIALSQPSVSDIEADRATATSLLTNEGKVSIIKKGFCYSTSHNPTINDATVEINNAGNTLSGTLTDLQPQTTYYLRAFASPNNGSPVYSTESTFQTAEKQESSELDNYTPPTYADNYTNMAGWDQRSQWNLANVHDPTVVLAEDGYYYMYQTDASYGNAHEAGGHFHGRRSKDLVNWEYLGGTMKGLPDWVIPKLNELRKEMGLGEYKQPDNTGFGYWAPCVRKVRNGLYRMYYSIVVPGTIDGNNSWGERAFIGLMENDNPANNEGWVDKGYVVTNASDKGLDFYVKPDNWEKCYFKWNAIDPSYIITPEGEHWLIYGSWHSGIAALRLNPEDGKPQETLPLPWGNDTAISPYGQLIATRQMGNRWQGSEGAEIIYNAQTGYYYLFVAYDALGVPYNTRVCRSKNITGPYEGSDGTNLTQFGGEMYPILTHPYKFKNSYGWGGISHCAIFEDGHNNWYYASQARFPENVDGNAYSNAIMMGHVRSIRWTEEGWPVVMPERYGNVPQLPIKEEELLGNWEHIDLSYSYGKQKESDIMTLSKDGKITAGTWAGKTWSYDAAQQILTANDIKLYLQRETDWEASPRHHTIVYVGLNGTKTYWGKLQK